MKPLRVGGRRGRATWASTTPRILAAHARRRAGRRRRLPARAGAAPSPPGTARRRRGRLPPARSTASTPSRSPCRRSCTARSPAPSWSAGSRRWSRSRWPRSLAEAEAARRPGQATGRRAPGRPHRAVQPRPVGPRAACRSGPSTSPAERLSTYTFRSTDIGVVLDLMIHDLDLVLSLVPAPVRVGRRGGRERLRRPRGHRQRPDRVRGRLRGQPHGQPRQLRRRRARCGSGAPRATPRSTSPPSRARSSAPRNSSAGASSTSTGVDLSQPAGGQGAPLRQDPPRRPGPDRGPRAAGARARGLRPGRAAATRPRVGGDDALRAMRLADQVLRSLDAHRWDGETATGPLPAQPLETPSVLRGPHAWPGGSEPPGGRAKKTAGPLVAPGSPERGRCFVIPPPWIELH